MSAFYPTSPPGSKPKIGCICLAESINTPEATPLLLYPSIRYMRVPPIPPSKPNTSPADASNAPGLQAATQEQTLDQQGSQQQAASMGNKSVAPLPNSSLSISGFTKNTPVYTTSNPVADSNTNGAPALVEPAPTSTFQQTGISHEIDQLLNAPLLEKAEEITTAQSQAEVEVLIAEALSNLKHEAQVAKNEGFFGKIFGWMKAHPILTTVIAVGGAALLVGAVIALAPVVLPASAITAITTGTAGVFTAATGASALVAAKVGTVIASVTGALEVLLPAIVVLGAVEEETGVISTVVGKLLKELGLAEDDSTALATSLVGAALTYAALQANKTSGSSTLSLTDTAIDYMKQEARKQNLPDSAIQEMEKALRQYLDSDKGQNAIKDLARKTKQDAAEVRDHLTGIASTTAPYPITGSPIVV